MRPPTGRIRFLALALAAAFAWPAGLPVASVGDDPARTAPAGPDSVEARPDGPRLHRPAPDDALASSVRIGVDDQSEESDEGDDAKSLASSGGSPAPGLFPSLIPHGLPANGPAPVRPALPIGATGRLRC